MARSSVALLRVAGKVYEGWEEVEVTRELNAAASDFTLKLTDRWREDQEPWRIAPGQRATISMGGLRVLTGYVEKFSANISASSRNMSVSGRSRTADIVDCSVTDLFSYSGFTLKDLAEKLCKPFNIKIFYRELEDAVLDSVTVTQGDSVFSVLEKYAKQRKVLMYPTTYGDLTFEGRGKKRTGANVKQGVNLVSGSVEWDNTNRYSEYSVKGQNVGFLGDAEQSTVTKGDAKDLGVTRFRPLILVAESSANDERNDFRANYEAELRAAQAIQCEVVVQGWFKQNDELWDVNELIYLDSGYLGVRRMMLVKKVSFKKSASGGTTTTLTLIREDAFGFDSKQKKKEDGLGWEKFTNSESKTSGKQKPERDS